MEIINVEQGTEEWDAARCGVISASNFSKVLAGGKGLTRRAYMVQLVAERLSGNPTPSFSNAAMEWGTETEPQARAAYELNQEVEVKHVGFYKFDDWVGCSPDGEVGDDGLVEIKCPNTVTQVDTFLKGEFPATHNNQVQGQLLVTDRQWCDFVSFDPRITGKAQYFIKRVQRDDNYINNVLWPGIEKFKAELKQLLEQLGA